MAERFKALVLKTSDGQPSVSSNLTASATFPLIPLKSLKLWEFLVGWRINLQINIQINKNQLTKRRQRRSCLLRPTMALATGTGAEVPHPSRQW